jgi:hypothetical protein
MFATLFPAFVSTVRSATRTWCTALAVSGVLALATACGSSSATSDPTAAAAASPSTIVLASQAAYFNCLREHGAVPPAKPTGKPTAKPTPKPTVKPTAKPTGTASGHKGAGTVPAAARTACASLRPSGANHKNKAAA